MVETYVTIEERAWSPSITRRLIEDFAHRRDPLPADEQLLEHVTPREREVLVLVGHRRSNREFAERLAITHEHGIVVPGQRPIR